MQRGAFAILIEPRLSILRVNKTGMVIFVKHAVSSKGSDQQQQAQLTFYVFQIF